MHHAFLSGQIVDLPDNRIFPGTIKMANGKITAIREEPAAEDHYILPGFIDAHIHIESSMLVPSEFARLAVLHGTVATVSDPHEIGNVLGLEGVRFMLENGKQVPFHFYFGASPCIPATSFETAGATITSEDIRTLFEDEKLKYLSEMMNYPGVLNGDPDVLNKIEIAQSMNKPIDGHAPGLRGEKAKAYIAAGITTDHECYTLDEALDKISSGMKIIIREGSAAKNFEALHPLLKLHPEKVMFCSDDKHPNELIHGHINEIVKKAIALGYDPLDVLRAACVNPVRHYHLDVGLLQEGDPADFIIVEDLKDFKLQSTYIRGLKVAEGRKSNIEPVSFETINRFNCLPKNVADFEVKAEGKVINVIKVIPGELITEKMEARAEIENGKYVSDPQRDILKLVVVNRYQEAPVSIAFIHGLGLKQGALASSVAHDSHNIIAAGVDDASLCHAVNAIIESKGGISTAAGNEVNVLPLPIAGLMSDQSGDRVAEKYAALKKKTADLGSELPDPFMTLSFLALLVIPSLKLSDKGLFDADNFRFVPLSP